MSRTRSRQRRQAPTWPAEKRSIRVLIEHPDPVARDTLANAIRGHGYEVVACGGPEPASEPAASCPLTFGASCPGVEGADVVVSSLAIDVPTEGLVVRKLLEGGADRRIVLEATDWQVAQLPVSSEGPYQHLYPFTVGRVLLELETLPRAPVGDCRAIP